MTTPLNVDALVKAAPAAKQYADELAKAAERWGIDTPLRQAHWLAQIAVESAGFTRLRESLNYSVDGLLRTFGRHRIGESDARKYGRTATQRANQPALANILYGGAFGARNLGNTQEGDGAKFIGRGFKQTTGRANYKRASQAIFGDDRLLDHPELLEQPEAAAQSAGVFWSDNKLNALADKDDVAAVTKKVNGGTLGLEGPNGRREWLGKFKRAFGA